MDLKLVTWSLFQLKFHTIVCALINKIALSYFHSFFALVEYVHLYGTQKEGKKARIQECKKARMQEGNSCNGQFIKRQLFLLQSVMTSMCIYITGRKTSCINSLSIFMQLYSFKMIFSISQCVFHETYAGDIQRRCLSHGVLL